MNQLRLFRSYGLILAVLTLAVSGCQSPNADAPLTASGFPEEIVHAATADSVLAITRDFFTDRGYVERESRHAYEVVFDKPEGNPRRALRVRVRLYGQPDGSWRMVGAPMGVEDWRSDLESERVLMQGAGQIQGFLVDIKNRVEARR